jgi:hypothetical protein
VYVAQGSHGSYVRPGHYDDPDPDDDADGEGLNMLPEHDQVQSGNPTWIIWPGRWGDSGNASPRGPQFQRATSGPIRAHGPTLQPRAVGSADPVSAAESPSPERRPWRSVLIRAVPLVALIALLSTQTAEGTVPGHCDENVEAGTELYDGCKFLDDVGYHLIRVVPSLLAMSFAVLAARLRRVRVVYVGFALGS